MSDRKEVCGDEQTGQRRPIRVCLVDDEPGVRSMVRRVLESDGGFSIVAEAANGSDAVSKIERSKPDVVLLDVHMPEMNGFEVLERLRQADGVPMTFLFTGDSRIEPKDAIRAGAQGIIRKGQSLRKIPAAIRDAIAIRTDPS